MVSEPLIPYVTLPELTLLPAHALGAFPPVAISIKPFGALVATGVYLGAYLALRRGRRLGLDERALTSFIVWMVGIGFIGGHVFDLIFYYPERLVADPLSVFRIWDGLSSFGGFAGGVIGMFVWRARHRVPILPYADVVASAFPVGWVFGRSGCAIAHDHPGILSDALLAVRYPGGGRFDLGLLEMLLSIPIAVGFLILSRRPRPWGFFMAIACIAYAPLRFALDFLREHEPVPGDMSGAIDPRYGQLTPAQWACVLLLGFGLWLAFRIDRGLESGQGFEAARVPSAFLPAPASDPQT